VLQARVPVLPGDDAERLAARVLEREHHIYPLAVRWYAGGRLALDPAGRPLLDGSPLPEPVQLDRLDPDGKPEPNGAPNPERNGSPSIESPPGLG
jgi:hypothetical protein